MRKNELPSIHPDPELLEVSIFRVLREQPEKEHCKRVEALLQLFSELKASASTRSKMNTVTGLRNLLSRYEWSCQISPQRDGFHAHWMHPRGLSPDDEWEYRAVRLLIELVPHLGSNPRIRRCAECEEWFFAASREDQQYCGGNCRQRHYDRSPEMRARKKDYMRSYRTTQQELAQNPRSGIGLRGRKSRKG